MEIELYSKLQNASDMEKVATMLGKSGIFGNERLEFGMAVLLTCAQDGITPIQFSRTYHLISGRVQKKAMAAFAEFRKRGAKVRWINSGDDGKEAKAEIDFEGVKSEHSFTIEQAKKQQLVKPNGNWDKTPGNMLRARLLSNAIGMLCPEIFTGDDDSTDEIEPKPLLPERPAETVKVEPKAEPVINVESSIVPPPKAKQEPSATPAEPPLRVYTEADIELSPETQRLTVGSMAALESTIGEALMPKFILWLKKNGWIQDTLSELAVPRAKNIMRKSGDLIANLKKAAQ
jgi:hypothetical protein